MAVKFEYWGLAKHIQTCKVKYEKCISVDTKINDDSSDD